MYICIYVYMYICIYVCVCVCVCVCTRVCIFVCRCLCTCMYMYMYSIRTCIGLHRSGLEREPDLYFGRQLGCFQKRLESSTWHSRGAVHGDHRFPCVGGTRDQHDMEVVVYAGITISFCAPQFLSHGSTCTNECAFCCARSDH